MHAIDSICRPQSWIQQPHHLITTVQTLAPNDVTSLRCQCLNPEYSGLIFLHWEEMEMHLHFIHCTGDANTTILFSVSAGCGKRLLFVNNGPNFTISSGHSGFFNLLFKVSPCDQNMIIEIETSNYFF